MPIVVTISNWLGTCWREAGGAVLLAGALLAGALLAAPAARAEVPCRSEEQVGFACEVDDGVVALCWRPSIDGGIASLVLRQVLAGRAPEQFEATPGNGQRFRGTVAPLRPGALARQVWFEQAGTRTLLAECVGGACPHAGALATLQQGRLIERRICRTGAQDLTWFSQRLVQFGSDADASCSRTPLLEIVDVDNGIERVFDER